MALTLSDLISPQTPQQIFQILLGVLQAQGFPVQSWQDGGVEKTRLLAFATALADVSGNYIPAIAGGGLLDYSSGAWLKLLAKQRFNIDYYQATNTVGSMALACSASGGPYTITTGQLIAVMSSGNRYINTTGGTLSTSGTLSLSWRSEFANDSSAGLNYVDRSNDTITLATPLPGVTITNPASTFSSVSQVGTGTGAIAPSGSPTLSHQVTVRIDASGQSGVASWSYSLDGAAYVSVGAVASSAIGSSGITVTLNNGSTNPSFIAGDLYTFNTPGTWITAQGTDEESDASLRSRCKARFPELGTPPTISVFEAWARAASSQVTQVRVIADGLVNNKVNVVIAGQAGILPAGVVSTVQAYINPRVSITDYVIVNSPVSQTITIGATVTVTAAKLAAAQANIQSAVQSYINSVGINGTVRIAEIIDAIMNVDGVVDVSGVTINGSAANLTLGSSSTFVIAGFTQDLTSTLTWLTA